MRHLCLYSVGVIDFTHHPPPIAPLADRAIRTAPIDQQGERPRARRQIAGNRQPDRCPSMRRRCSEADRPRPDRGSDPRPNEPVDKSREYLARSADGMGAKRPPFRQSFPHDKQLTALSKAKVEAGVRFAQTYILGRLRAQTFFSLAECNQAITLVMQRMNERTMRHLGLSRRDRRARRLPWAATESGGRVGWRAEPPLRAESGGYVDSAIFHPKSNGQYRLKRMFPLFGEHGPGVTG